MEAIHRTLPTNPNEKANIFSSLFFLWTLVIFKRCKQKNNLEIEDFFQPLKDDRSEYLGNRLERNWNEILLRNKNPSLMKALAKTFWKEFTVVFLLSILNEFGIRLATPILLGKLLNLYKSDEDISSDNFMRVVFYGCLIVGLVFLNAITYNQQLMKAFYVGSKCRIAVCSIIYRKSLRLSQTAFSNTSPGKLVNLLSNDVSKLDLASVFLPHMFMAPFLVITISIILWQDLGWSGIIGMLPILILTPFQLCSGKLSYKFRSEATIWTEKRIDLMNEIISGIKVIKMYAWELPFSKLIQITRFLEIKAIRKNTHIRGILMTINMFITRAAIMSTITSLYIMSEPITSPRIFAAVVYFNVLQISFTHLFVRGIGEFSELLVSFRRFQTFLKYEEKNIFHESSNIENFVLKLNSNQENIKWQKQDILENNVIQIKDIVARWTASVDEIIKNPPVLDDISFNVKKGSLLGIIGSVGSGKSSILQLILGELPFESGTLNTNGKLSFASQEPWVFSASVRQNILFGDEMDEMRYKEILKSCALSEDIEQFSDGDTTIIGENGTILSGGQKARVNLARALYHNADIYLFDDPLSAVDAQIGRHLFDNIIGPFGSLAKASLTRILVTHQIQYLRETDWIIILKDGKVHMQGTPDDLVKSEIDFFEYLENDNQTTMKEKTKQLNNYSNGIKKNNLKSSNDSRIDIKEKLQTLESSSKDKIEGSVLFNYFKYGGNYFFLIITSLLFLITQSVVSLADYWTSYWTSKEELRTFYKEQNLTIEEISFDGTQTILRLNNAINNIEPETLLISDIYMSINISIVILIVVFGLIRCEVLYTLCMRASRNLHDHMLKKLVSSALRFFEINPSGRILNRFSKDLGVTDEILPKVLLDASQIILNASGSIVLTLIIKPLLSLPAIVLFCVFFFVRKFYIATSKNIKRFDGITRSPVFTHLTASLNGLSTIRAFCAESVLIKEFDYHQDLHSGIYYTFLCTNSAFGIFLDILASIFLAFVVIFFLTLNDNEIRNNFGLTLSQTISFSLLIQWGIRQSAEVSNQLTSTERLLEYCQMETEEDINKTPIILSETWPSQGKIEFKNVVYRYYRGAEPVLKNISFVIKPKEKIGIIGRTGAGKSSLIGALFRLAQIEGEIFIDNIETSLIKLQKLRSKIAIIPQDPVLFSGTLQRNLDPFNEYQDEDLWMVLEDVKLKEIFNNSMGLLTLINNGGSNFSIGQRQLLCLARAILRKNQILVLDEATANIDPITDNLIQNTIREKFRNCTVLTIAHRLITIMDSDRVLVMNFGDIKEFDSPYRLLQQSNSIFRSMVLAEGSSEIDRMSKIANKQKHKF